jgi:hypothetical protein
LARPNDGLRFIGHQSCIPPTHQKEVSWSLGYIREDPKSQYWRNRSSVSTAWGIVDAATMEDLTAMIHYRSDCSIWKTGTRSRRGTQGRRSLSSWKMLRKALTIRQSHWMGEFLGTGAIRMNCVTRSMFGLREVLGMLKLDVYTEHFREIFSGFWLRILCVCNGLFDADDLMAFRALAKVMTGAIHFVPWSKPTHGGQFWLFHVLSFPQAAFRRYPCGFQIAWGR